ncbi:30S ribosomal protein S2 [Gracilariopsis chorda]|uniref:30S ribosomal protein S2 n=1 Tax=Gracilariopsis chorda TaxID=448386 RepID=A0A2V3IXS7_9FLOR|nr:30S ribosomal protein S2 [Gracilariopsis chorda]|eukprot:PXF45940.1 30S ribosomal protein S2 [Gracilariopsis chorda]
MATRNSISAIRRFCTSIRSHTTQLPDSDLLSSPKFSASANSTFHQYSVQDLMNARVHMGHRTKLWNPKMAPYILGHRNGMHILNLDVTATMLRRALIAASHMAENDCTFLWLGPRDPQKSKIVEKQARKAGAYTIDGARWIGGTLTNPIKSNQAQRFNYRIPDCVFVVDTIRHMPALREARLCGIPTIGIVDSDCDPQFLTYPIPGNDDAALAIYLYCSLMKHALLDGRARGRRLSRPSVQIPSLKSAQRARQRFR